MYFHSSCMIKADSSSMTKYVFIQGIVIILSLISYLSCKSHEVAEKDKTAKLCSAAKNLCQTMKETCDFDDSVKPQTGRPIDCTDLKQQGHKTGVYMIYPKGSEGFKVYCDMDTMDKGWTVFQRRFNGKVDFYRNWDDYKIGFGNVTDEYWLGNEHINQLTDQGEYILRIVLEDFEKNERYAEYNSFNVGSEKSGYKLSVTGYHGNAGDSLLYSNGQMFSTKDKDNDEYSGSCSQSYKGAWWYSNCHYSNLNGLYLNGKTAKIAEGMVWYHWKGYQYSLKSSTMMIRRTED